MVGVQDQDAIHGAFQYRVHHVLFARGGEHHVQEVAGIGQIVARINERLAQGVFVAHRGYGRHFGQQTERGDFTVTLVVDVQRIVVERRQRAGHAAQHRHRVRVATEATEQMGDLVVDHGVTGNGRFEGLELFRRRGLAVQQDVAHFQVGRFFRQLFDREAAVQQHAFVAVDEGNLGFARSGGGKAGIKCEITFGTQSADIEDIRAQCRCQYAQFDRSFAVVNG